MDEFIRVILADPHYDDKKCWGFVLAGSIRIVSPVYGVKDKDGKLKISRFDRKDTKCIYLHLTDHAGNTFACHDYDSMVTLIGIDYVEEIFGEKIEQEKIGFQSQMPIHEKELDSHHLPPV